ncbi:acyltransferase family protein [Streptomyces sp. NPDC005776]|uniref:acyltransferase family protein n=1 Tax=Streptomyces sp. NPDC005776 TaxID=3154676 RepID=UPI0033E07090
MSHAPNAFQRATLPPATRESEPRPQAPETAGGGLAAAQERPPRAAPTKRRDAYFDNAKYLAIVLVAVAHSWVPVMDGSRAARALYMVTYTFHMPAFIIISGYFSRSFDMSPAKVKRLVTGVAVPYVVFETAYSLFRRYADQPGAPISLTEPWYLTWFLAALFVWRLTTPLWRNLRHPLAVSLVIACLASLAPGIGNDLDLPRVFQFLPFFVLGLQLKPEHFQLVRRREVRRLALPLFAVAVLFAYWAAPRMELGWFLRDSAAQDMGAPWWAGAVMTLALFGCATLLTAAFLSLVPRRHTWFTVLGAGTICGYLLHGFMVKGATYSGLFDRNEWLISPIGLVLVTVVASAGVTLLCTPPVQRALRCVTEPDMNWAFRRDSGKL